MVLVVLTAGILIVESAIRGRSYHRTGTGTRRKPPLVKLGPWRWPALVLVSLLVVAAVGVPIGVSALWLVRGVVHGEIVSLEVGTALTPS